MWQVYFPTAYIISKNEFEFLTPIKNPLIIGSFVKILGQNETFIGLITEQNLISRTFEEDSTPLIIRQFQGRGEFLGKFTGAGLIPMSNPEPEKSFRIEKTSTEEISSLIDFLSKNCKNMPLAKYRLNHDILINIEIDQLTKHTFICGQTGSGKSTAMRQFIGNLLESPGNNKLIIFDLNSDFVDFAIKLQKEGIKKGFIFSNKYNVKEGCIPLKIDINTMTFEELAEMIKVDMMNLDKIYKYRKEIWDIHLKINHITPDQLLEKIEDNHFKIKLENLGLMKWQIWRTDFNNESINDVFNNEKQIDNADYIVVDLGDFNDYRQRNFIIEYILKTIWNNRVFSKNQEENIFLIIDEAHNICPPKSDDSRIQRMTDYLKNIAGEGRKYNLNLVLSSQQPSKIHENIISLCNNLILLKTTSSMDLDFLFSKFSFIPKSFFNEARFLDWCEAIIGGVFTKNIPFFIKF